LVKKKNKRLGRKKKLYLFSLSMFKSIRREIKARGFDRKLPVSGDFERRKNEVLPGVKSKLDVFRRKGSQN
jgi:hypothetical protein